MRERGATVQRAARVSVVQLKADGRSPHTIESYPETEPRRTSLLTPDLGQV